MDMNETPTTPVDAEVDDLPGFHITVPDPLSCLPDRARFAPGRNHSHPMYASIIVDARPPRPITDQASGVGAVVRSVEPECAVTFHKRQPTFAGFSVKNGRMISGTGPHELAAFKRLETDHTTVEYDFQNLEITCEFEGAISTYTPDFTRVTDTGRLVAVEVKADASHFVPHIYHNKLERAASGLAEIGIEFRRTTGSELRGEARFQFNVSRAFGDRFTFVAPSLLDAVLNRLAKNRYPVSLGAIEEILDTDKRIARAKVHALLCQREIAFELTGVITPETPISLPRRPNFIPDIRTIGHESHNF